MSNEFNMYTRKRTAVRGAERAGLAAGTYTVELDAATKLWFVSPFSPVEVKAPAPVKRKSKTPAKAKAGKTAPVSKDKGNGPVQQVREFVWANPDMPTGEVIAELCGKRGLNASMVRTRLSWIRRGVDPATRDRNLGRT